MIKCFLANRMRELRKAAGLTQDEVAKYLNIERQTLFFACPIIIRSALIIFCEKAKRTKCMHFFLSLPPKRPTCDPFVLLPLKAKKKYCSLYSSNLL